MAWEWDQSEGCLYQYGGLVSRGYSGNGRGKNNPAMQAAVGVGPIPAGPWRLVEVKDSENTGPFTIVLHAADAAPGDDIHQGTGRSAFRIHGDSIKNPGTASHGCIILPRAIRERMWRSGDRDLIVRT